MRGFLVTLVLAASFGVWSTAAPLTAVQGEVTEPQCALTSVSRGEAHAACAMACARDGKPMALVTDDAVYIVEGSYAADRNAKLLDFVGRSVEAKGTIRQHEGVAYINVAAMMVQK